MNAKKLLAPLFAGALMFGIASVAHADPIYMDLGAGGGVDGHTDSDGLDDPDQKTEAFNQFGVYAETRTTQFDTDGNGVLSDGDKFSDFGHLNVTNIIPGSGGDNEGLNTIGGYQLTAAWTDLKGTASGLVPGSTPGTFTSNIQYDKTANTTFNFFVDDSAGGRTNFNYGANNASAGDDVTSTFTDGVNVLSILIVGGFGTNTFDAAGKFLTGSSTLIGVVTGALPDFLFFEDGDLDFADLIGKTIKIKVSIDQNTDQNNASNTIVCPGDPACTPGAIFVVDSNHDGSISFVLVPEPASVLMFGLGFLAIGGVAFATRRREA